MKNSKIGAIIKNEIEKSIKNKWFVILNLLLLIVTVVGLNFNNFKALLKQNEVSFSNQMSIYIEDKDELVYEDIVDIFKENEEVTVEKKESVDDLKTQELSKDIILLEVEKSKSDYIDASITTQETVSSSYIQKIEEVLNSKKDELILENEEISYGKLEKIKEDVNINRVILSDSINTDETISIIQIFSNYLIFFILLLCLNKIANTISQEKMSKSIEYILTSITTKEYIISKVLSMCLIVILQFVFMLAYLIVGIMISSLFTLNTVSIDGVQSIDISGIFTLKTIGYMAITFVFMCLTTFLQGVIQTVMSAKTTNIQEAGNATIFLVTLNLILYTVVTVLISPLKTTSVIAYIISVLPIASMYFIPAMFVIGQANIFQIIISLVILVASIPLTLILVQKPFKNAILDYSAKRNKKIEGIEKIIATREYQERMIDRKESSKKGLIVSFAVILLIILQVIGGLIVTTFMTPISQKITFMSQGSIYLLLMCIVFAVSIYLPYLILKAYLPKENKKEITKEENKKSIIKAIKYIVVSIPVISVIQMICSFAVDKIGIGADVTDALGLFNYNGKLATILLFIQIAILPAIFEELFIRKGVFGVLRSKGPIFACVVSALIFATIHMNISQFTFAFLVGILFGIVRERTGKLYPTMILHFINNGIAVIEVLFYDHMTFMQIFTYGIIALNAIGFCILIYMLYKKVMELKDKESVQKFKEELDYRKIKINITENLFVFKDYTFFVAAVLSAIIFTVVEKML